MKTLNLKRKRLSLIIMTLLFFLSSFWLHKVYAGKPVISLNSPVSFPVDI